MTGDRVARFLFFFSNFFFYSPKDRTGSCMENEEGDANRSGDLRGRNGLRNGYGDGETLRSWL